MSLPKEGIYTLLVEGRSYLWMVRRSGDSSNLRITVQREDTGEWFLLMISIELFQKIYKNGIYHNNVVAPADVKKFIMKRFQV